MKNYFDIIKPVKPELDTVNSYLEEFLSDFSKYFAYDIVSNSKKIRSAVTILFVKMIFGKIENLKLCALVELLHNTSLIHDDVVDDADIRRNAPSFKKVFGNKEAVIAGDFLLSVALKEYGKFEGITDLFADTLITMCRGEAEQLAGRNKLPTVEDYILKSEQKTSELFKLSLKSCLIAQNGKEYLPVAEDFAKYFGIAFQIRDDINDIICPEKNNHLENDIKNGIYTLPVILYRSQNPNAEINAENIKNSEALNDSIALCHSYFDKALDLLNDFSDNQYKQTLTDLCKMLKRF